MRQVARSRPLLRERSSVPPALAPTTGLFGAIAPALACLLAAAVALIGLIRLSGARWSWRRVAAVTASETGAVQALSFVLTFPVFVMIVLFIFQISQLMIGMMVVHYASFAAARSAQVWIPATTSVSADGEYDANRLSGTADVRGTVRINAPFLASNPDLKLDEIWTAAMLACLPIAPSRSIAVPDSPYWLGELRSALLTAYSLFDPAAATNSQIPTRLDRKLRYCANFTQVALTFTDRSSGPERGGNDQSYNPVGHPSLPYDSSEAGWQDTVTVTVMHDFRLLPGPGKWLAARLANNDPIASRIYQTGNIRQVTLSASTTMTLEGLKSVRPYIEGTPETSSTGGENADNPPDDPDRPPGTGESP